MAFVTPVVEHWLEQEIAHWVHHEQSLLPTKDRHMFYDSKWLTKISSFTLIQKISLASG